MRIGDSERDEESDKQYLISGMNSEHGIRKRPDSLQSKKCRVGPGWETSHQSEYLGIYLLGNDEVTCRK